MTPSHIRETILYVQHLRRDLQQRFVPDFIGDSCIGEKLTKCIAELKALHIPKRLQVEHMEREAEIGACEDLLRLWLKERGQCGPLERVTCTLVSPDGSRLELGEGVQCDFETHAEEGTAAHEVTERLYGRGGVVLRVIDGGKK